MSMEQSVLNLKNNYVTVIYIWPLGTQLTTNLGINDPGITNDIDRD